MKGELHMALLQVPLAWEQPEHNRETFARMIAGLPDTVDLILLPEMFSTGFTMTPEHIDEDQGPLTVEWMKSEARTKNAAICGSMVYREASLNYNRLYFVYPDGQTKFYNKRHTFTLAGEDKIYTAGTEKLMLEYRGFRICPLICYDLRFPVWSRNVEEYDLLVFLANWPAKRIQAWDTLLRARAIENMAFCAGVNRIGTDDNGHLYSGHSAVYDCLGNILGYSEEEGVLSIKISKRSLTEIRDSLKFLDDRDRFTLLG